MPEKNNVTLIIDTKNLKIQIHISFAESMIWDWNPKIFPFVAFWSTIFGFASGRGRRDWRLKTNIMILEQFFLLLTFGRKNLSVFLGHYHDLGL